MEFKDLTKIQIQDLNGIWHSKTPQNIITYTFENGQLTTSDNNNQPRTYSVKIHPISSNRASLIGPDDIMDIELFCNKFLVLKNSKGFYLLLVKFPINQG